MEPPTDDDDVSQVSIHFQEDEDAVGEDVAPPANSSRRMQPPPDDDDEATTSSMGDDADDDLGLPDNGRRSGDLPSTTSTPPHARSAASHQPGHGAYAKTRNDRSDDEEIVRHHNHDEEKQRLWSPVNSDDGADDGEDIGVNVDELCPAAAFGAGPSTTTPQRKPVRAVRAGGTGGDSDSDSDNAVDGTPSQSRPRAFSNKPNGEKELHASAHGDSLEGADMVGSPSHRTQLLHPSTSRSRLTATPTGPMPQLPIRRSGSAHRQKGVTRVVPQGALLSGSGSPSARSSPLPPQHRDEDGDPGTDLHHDGTLGDLAVSSTSAQSITVSAATMSPTHRLGKGHQHVDPVVHHAAAEPSVEAAALAEGGADDEVPQDGGDHPIDPSSLPDSPQAAEDDSAPALPQDAGPSGVAIASTSSPPASDNTSSPLPPNATRAERVAAAKAELAASHGQGNEDEDPLDHRSAGDSTVDVGAAASPRDEVEDATAALDEWDQANAERAAELDQADAAKALPPVRSITWSEANAAFRIQERASWYPHTANLSRVSQKVKTTGFWGTVWSCFHNDIAEGTPLWDERDYLLALRAVPFSHENENHRRVLLTIWRLLERPGRSQPDPPTMGTAWGRLGFQGTDPATDLRSTGMLGLLQLLHLVQCRSPLATALFQEATSKMREFSLAIVAFNFTSIVLNLLMERVLHDAIVDRFQKHDAEQVKQTQRLYGGTTDVADVMNEIYVGLWHRFFEIWTSVPQRREFRDFNEVRQQLVKEAQSKPSHVRASGVAAQDFRKGGPKNRSTVQSSGDPAPPGRGGFSEF